MNHMALLFHRILYSCIDICLQIDQSTFESTINRLNEIYADAESLGARTYMEGCFSCMTAYTLLLCMETHYDKVWFCTSDSKSYLWWNFPAIVSNAQNFSSTTFWSSALICTKTFRSNDQYKDPSDWNQIMLCFWLTFDDGFHC